VAKDKERDRSVERLLQATRGSTPPLAPSPACVDAGLIATWAEGALGPDETARVEAHLAECVRCQAVVAAFAHAEPAAPQTVRVWKRWAALLPIAAATATAVIWVAWPRRQTPAAPVATVAEAPPIVVGQPQPPPVPISPLPAARAQAAAGAARSARSSARGGATAAKPIAPMTPSPVFRSVAPPAATPVPLGVPPPAGQPPSSVSTQAAPRPAALSDSSLLDQRRVSSIGNPSALQATIEPIVVFESPAAVGGGAGGASAVGQSAGRGGGRPTALREAAALASAVTRWRILASRDLERSTDDGRTWERVAIDPPLPLTNGAAPSQLVCWLVGRAGVVLVTNDASHFTRIAFPATIDLSAVQATDVLNATVTTADGRTFVTTDGGKTWADKHLLTAGESNLRPTKARERNKP
jgi:hypothetical protein